MLEKLSRLCTGNFPINEVPSPLDTCSLWRVASLGQCTHVIIDENKVSGAQWAESQGIENEEITSPLLLDILGCVFSLARWSPTKSF